MKFTIFYIVLACFTLAACKTSVQRKGLNQVDLSANSSPEEDLLENSIEDLQKAIDTYKETEEYKAPSSESEKDFNSMVDAIDELDKEASEFLAEKGEFANADKRAEEIEERTSAEEEETTDDNGRAIKKSGILMVSLGTLGLAIRLGLGAGLEVGYQKLKNPNTAPELPENVQKQVDDMTKIGKDLGSRELDLWVNRFRIANLAFAGMPIALILMGSMLVAEEKPSDSLISASQVALYTAGTLSAGAGVSLAALAANPSWTRNVVDAIASKATNAAVKAFSDPGSPDKLNPSGGFGNKHAISDETIAHIRKFSLGSGLILAALGGTALFSGSSLNLAAVGESPKSRMLKAVSLFVERMKKVEAHKKSG